MSQYIGDMILVRWMVFSRTFQCVSMFPPYHAPLGVIVDKLTSAVGVHTLSTRSSESREVGESPADESYDEDYPYPGVELILRLAPT
jgi:hypothetical protein